MQGLSSPLSIAIADRVRELKAKGKDIVSFTQGEPDYNTPSHIKEAAVRALHGNDTHYTPSRGYPELRSAIAEQYRIGHGMVFDPSSEIVVTPGAKHAIYATLQAMIEPGDEVLIPQPCWLSYTDMVCLAGGIAVPVPSVESNQYIPTIEALDERVGPRTRLVMLNNPCNPTGAVWPREKLASFAEWVKHRNLVVVADEIYDRIVFDRHEFIPFASLPDMAERTVTVNGFSKTYAMTGWRIGYVCGPSSLLEPILTVHENIATCAASFVQHGALAALQGPQEDVKAMVSEYQRRRDLFCAGLSDIPGISCHDVQGTFYAFIRVGGDDRWVAEDLLSTVGVAAVPGSAYGACGAGCLRFSFACAQSALHEGINRMRDYFASHAGPGAS